MSIFQNYEYEVLQVGPKDYGSQNFSFIVCKREAVGVVQNFANSGNGVWQTEFFLSLKSCFLPLKRLKRENLQKKIQFQI
jgi:hypothetical protein